MLDVCEKISSLHSEKTKIFYKKISCKKHVFYTYYIKLKCEKFIFISNCFEKNCFVPT